MKQNTSRPQRRTRRVSTSTRSPSSHASTRSKHSLSSLASSHVSITRHRSHSISSDASSRQLTRSIASQGTPSRATHTMSQRRSVQSSLQSTSLGDTMAAQAPHHLKPVPSSRQDTNNRSIRGSTTSPSLSSHLHSLRSLHQLQQASLQEIARSSLTHAHAQDTAIKKAINTNTNTNISRAKDHALSLTTFRSSKPLRAPPAPPGAAPGLMESLATSGSLSDNPLFTAGLGMTAIGVSLSILRKAALQGLVLLERHFTTSLEIPSKDRSYHWVLNWCTAQTKGTSKHIGVETRVVHHGNGVHTTSFDFVPSPGRHYIWYNRHLIQIVREREKSMMDITSGSPFETVKLTVFSRNREIFSEILKDAENSAMKKQEGRITIYMPMMTDWRQFGRPRPKRRLDSVILDEGIAEMLESDIKEFQRGSKWYADKGIPHRRGYLLHGPPGSGKTSFIQALAGELGYSICVLSLNDRGLTDDRLLHLMTELPPRSMILLEDIDAVFNQRESTFSVTFSGLLNALDGVTSIDERLVFMTTNHVEKLDPALIRPGRVDVRVYIGDSTPYQQRMMFKSFYPEINDDDSSSSSSSSRNNYSSSSHKATTTTSSSGSGDSDHFNGKQETFVRGLLNRVVESTGLDDLRRSDTGTVVEDGRVKRLSLDAVSHRLDTSTFATAPQLTVDGQSTGGMENDDDWLNPDKILARAEAEEKAKKQKAAAAANDSQKDSNASDPSTKPVTERIPSLLTLRDEVDDELKKAQQPPQTPTAQQLESAKLLQTFVNEQRREKGLRELPLEDFLKDDTLSFNRKAKAAQQQQEQQQQQQKQQQQQEQKASTTTTTTTNTTSPSQDSTSTSKPIDYVQLSKQKKAEELRKKTEYEKLCDEFVDALSGVPISMAELQSLMLQYKDQPRLCIEGARQLRDQKKKQLEEKEMARLQQEEEAALLGTPADVLDNKNTNTNPNNNKKNNAGTPPPPSRPVNNQPFQSSHNHHQQQYLSDQMSQAMEASAKATATATAKANLQYQQGNANNNKM